MRIKVDVKRKEDEDIFDSMLEAFEQAIKECKSEYAEKMTPRKKAQIDRKLELTEESDNIDEELEEVTDNTYVEIGEFLNEYMENDIKAKKELYDRCKKWLSHIRKNTNV